MDVSTWIVMMIRLDLRKYDGYTGAHMHSGVVHGGLVYGTYAAEKFIGCAATSVVDGHVQAPLSPRLDVP